MISSAQTSGSESPSRPAAEGELSPVAAALRTVPIFADLPATDLEWIGERAELLELDAGDVLFGPGEPAEWMFVAVEGVLQARREPLGPNAPTFVFRAGDIGGTVPFSRMTSFAGAGRALTPSTVVRFPKARFGELLAHIPGLTQRFVSMLVDRVRDSTRRDAQFEKLTALGQLSAGLAHELNNPTSVVQRALAESHRRLDERGRLVSALVATCLPPDAILRLDSLRTSWRDRSAAGRSKTSAHRALPARDAMARSDEEESLAEWLAAEGLKDPWVSASTFLDADVDVAALDAALLGVQREARVTALQWIEAELAAEMDLRSARVAAERIESILDDVREYTHRDRPRDMIDVDVREGLETTLALFATRLKEKGVQVTRVYPETIVKIRAFPGDLNQVWHNLIDNALDALPPGDGRIRVCAEMKEGAIVVEVADNGPGIPDDLSERVWEPFFTTKDVGQGTGLGLDIARRIVVDLHGGEMSFVSVPGDTRFIVRLPLTTSGTFGA